MHMMLAGRYRYDVANREPAAPRLMRMGVPRQEIASIMLSGQGRFPLDAAWPSPGIVRMAGDAGTLAFQYYIDSAIFSARSAGESFDYFVNLGRLTPVDNAR